MLVLTRKYQEKIRIGNDITITVLRTKGKAVRLGIEAPSTVPVIRGELKFEDRAAATAKAEVGAVAAASAGSGSRHGDVAAEPSWTTMKRARSGSRGRVASPAAQVGHHRIPRDKVPELMPRLVSGNAPLRALLEQRSPTV